MPRLTKDIEAPRHSIRRPTPVPAAAAPRTRVVVHAEEAPEGDQDVPDPDL